MNALLHRKTPGNQEIIARISEIRADTIGIPHGVAVTNERRVFPSPWHWCVHGQGLGQLPTGFDLKSANLLCEVGLAVKQSDQNPFHIFAQSLVQDIIAVCAEKSPEVKALSRSTHTNFYQTLALLPRDTWQYARACAVLTETLVKLGKLTNYDSILRMHMDIALKRVEALAPETVKGRYEKLQLLASLFLASGQAGWTDLLTSQPPHGISRIYNALRMTEDIPDLFYRGRVAATLISVVATIGYGYVVCGDRLDYMRNLLDAFDAQLDQLATRSSDGVHENFDYCLFPLSLTLNAIALLGRPEYLEYRRNWAAQAATYFATLAPASRASQMLFYVHALENLGVLGAYVPNLKSLLSESIEAYLRQVGDSVSSYAYLRCTYLIQMAHQFGYPDVLPPKIWNILATSGTHFQHTQSPTYGSGYMIAAYTLSAFIGGDRIAALAQEEGDLPTAVAAIKATQADAALNLPKLDFALIDAALQLRPAHPTDTRLFSEVKFASKPKSREI